jgi:hypothetical protein
VVCPHDATGHHCRRPFSSRPAGPSVNLKLRTMMPTAAALGPGMSKAGMKALPRCQPGMRPAPGPRLRPKVRQALTGWQCNSPSKRSIM